MLVVEVELLECAVAPVATLGCRLQADAVCGAIAGTVGVAAVVGAVDEDGPVFRPFLLLLSDLMSKSRFTCRL